MYHRPRRWREKGIGDVASSASCRTGLASPCRPAPRNGSPRASSWLVATSVPRTQPQISDQGRRSRTRSLTPRPSGAHEATIRTDALVREAHGRHWPAFCCSSVAALLALPTVAAAVEAITVSPLEGPVGQVGDRDRHRLAGRGRSRDGKSRSLLRLLQLHPFRSLRSQPWFRTPMATSV